MSDDELLDWDEDEESDELEELSELEDDSLEDEDWLELLDRDEEELLLDREEDEEGFELEELDDREDPDDWEDWLDLLEFEDLELLDDEELDDGLDGDLQTQTVSPSLSMMISVPRSPQASTVSSSQMLSHSQVEELILRPRKEHLALNSSRQSPHSQRSPFTRAVFLSM